MKTTYKLTLAALLASGLLILSACSGESGTTPTTAGTTTAPTPTVTTVATASPDDPAVTPAPEVTTTPQVTTTESTPDTNEPSTSEPATTEEPTPATTEEPSLVEQMANMGCPEELIPTIEREANAEELAAIGAFFSDEYAKALLVDGFYTPEAIDLRGFFEWSYCIPDRTWPKEASAEEATAVKMAIGMVDWPGGDCACWTAEELNKITVKYLGVALEDVILNAMVDRGGVQFPKIYYLAQYDSYYMLSPGFSYEAVQILSAWRTADGNYLVHYNGFTDSMVTVLTPYENSFRISLAMELVQNPLASVQ